MDLLRTLDEKVAPGHAALVTVDVQNDFCHEDGFLGSLGAPMGLIQAMVPRLGRFARRRPGRAGCPSFTSSATTTSNTHRPWSPSRSSAAGCRWSSTAARGATPPTASRARGAPSSTESRPGPGEEIVVKHRYSGFRSTNLDLLLRSRGIQTVILTGAATNVCVESTARDVYMHDYYLVFVSDGTATTSEGAHQTPRSRASISSSGRWRRRTRSSRRGGQSRWRARAPSRRAGEVASARDIVAVAVGRSLSPRCPSCWAWSSSASPSDRSTASSPSASA